MKDTVFAQMTGNLLLAKLNEEDRRRLAPHMNAVDLESRHLLQMAGDIVYDTWFPCGAAMASFQVWVDDRNDAIEVALVGREGAIGGIVSNGHIPAYASAQVRTGGRFLHIKTATLENAKLESLSLRHWFARYSDCLIAQIFQTAACNATHTIIQRTAKWLLAAVSRTQGKEIRMTQQQLAEMLGVGRTFVTRIVSQLRQEGLIETRRGVFIIRNDAALRRRSCGCTMAIESHFDAVLQGIYPTD
jgi:hypothetical protein